MAIIDSATLKRIAEISRLRLDEKEAEAFAAEFGEILSYFSKIAEIEARGRELYYVRHVENVLRSDVPKQREEEAKGVRNQFARREEGYLIAPKSL